MTASIFPLPFADGVHSMRFYRAGATSGAFSGNEWQFLIPGNTREQIGSTQTGSTPVTVTGTLSRRSITPGSVAVHWTKVSSVTNEDPTVAPAENGVVLSFTVTTAHSPISNDNFVINWTEGATGKTATINQYGAISGTNAANISSAALNRTTGVLTIVFGATHAPAANTIRVSYSYAGTDATVTDSNGTFTATGVTGTVNYSSGDISLTFTGAAVVPYNGSTVTVDYDGLQGWSKGIRITSEAGGYVEISFDGTNVHGRVDDGAVVEYFDRYEGGISLRGSGDFIVEAW